MDVSIVIVTYNVRPFIKLCLDSIFASHFKGPFEVIIIDNNSCDGSLEYMQTYTQSNLTIHANTINVGFSKACNQGAERANGKYLLFLNPDTLIREDLIELSLDFYRSKDNIGILGASLYDGGLNYLPESKRKFPTLANAIGRLALIDGLFKGSKLDYYNRSSSSTYHSVDVLTGAFMLIAKTKFDIVSGFDESYFMYGEDIDLSLRVNQSGYINYYNSDLELIHFKGESTKGNSLSYHKHFFGAMITYTKKHLVKSTFMANTVIGPIIRIFSSVKYVARTVRKPLMDYMFLLSMLFVCILLWAKFYHGDASYYPKYLFPLWFFMPSVWIFGLFLFGKYMNDIKSDLRQVFSGLILGSFLFLGIYALLPEQLRFSRFLLFMPPTLYTIFWAIFSFSIRTNKVGSLVWAMGDIMDQERILLNNIFAKFSKSTELGDLDLIGRRVIIDTSTIPISQILDHRSALMEAQRIIYWDRSQGLFFDSKEGRVKGLSYDELSLFNLSSGVHQMHKKIFDVGLSIVLLPLIILSCLFSWNMISFRNIKDILLGRKTMVGYSDLGQTAKLPYIPKGMISNRVLYKNQIYNPASMDKDYALHYSIWKDAICCTLNIFGLIFALNQDNER